MISLGSNFVIILICWSIFVSINNRDMSSRRLRWKIDINDITVWSCEGTSSYPHSVLCVVCGVCNLGYRFRSPPKLLSYLLYAVQISLLL